MIPILSRRPGVEVRGVSSATALMGIILLVSACQTPPGAGGAPDPSAGGLAPARAVIQIDGMACPFCTYNIQRQLEALDGVERTDVSLEKGEAYVTLSPNNPATADQLRRAVESAGFTPMRVRMPRDDKQRPADERTGFELSGPTSLTAHPDGGWLVTDSGHDRLVRFDAEGRGLASWGGRGEGPGALQRPLGVAVGPEGRIFVADYLNDRVQVLDRVGHPVAQWTGFGDGERFNGPADVAVDVNGHVYVVEFNGGRVIKLNAQGDLIRQSGERGHGRGQFYYPTRIAVGPDGRVWVTDAYNHRLKVYTPAGELKHIIGGKGERPGQFNVPGGVAFDGAGGFWVADFFNNRVQHFDVDDTQGEPAVTVWTGEHSDAGPLRQPTDLAFGPNHEALYIVDHGRDRLVRFDPRRREATAWE